MVPILESTDTRALRRLLDRTPDDHARLEPAVREILAAVRGELGAFDGPFHTVATGGYADLIAANVPEVGQVRPDFTLEGLRIIALLNCGTPLPLPGA